MKRSALVTFALIAAGYQLLPASITGPAEETLTCKVDYAFRGHPTMREMADGEARLNCGEKASRMFHFSADDSREMAIVRGMREGDRVRVKVVGSRVLHSELLSARVSHLPRIEKAAIMKPAPKFTIIYPCASFERAGHAFPIGTEAAYPKGCNVVAELESDRQAERKAMLAANTAAGWSNITISSGEPVKEKKVKTARKAPAPEILPWQVSTAVAERPTAPKTLFDLIFN